MSPGFLRAEVYLKQLSAGLVETSMMEKKMTYFNHNVIRP